MKVDKKRKLNNEEELEDFNEESIPGNDEVDDEVADENDSDIDNEDEDDDVADENDSDIDNEDEDDEDDGNTPNVISLGFARWQRKFLAAKIARSIPKTDSRLDRKTYIPCPVSECPYKKAKLKGGKKSIIQHLVRLHYREALWVKEFHSEKISGMIKTIV